MVLKGIFRYIINRYLKNYIEQLDDEKLNFDLRNGHVSMGNLHLKPEALADLNLPVSVSAGYLENLTLTIPWLSLSSHPTRVQSGLYVLIVPKNEVDLDLTEYHAKKMRRVQRKVDNLRKSLLENKKMDEKEVTFFERKRLQIMQNMEVTVENLHISYETSSTTKLGHSFSFGFTLHYLKLITSTDNTLKKRSKDITPIIYTLKEINSLSVYWNTQCKSRMNTPFEIVINDLKSKIATNNYNPGTQDMNYILYPVNLKLNMKIIMTAGENNFNRPEFNVKCLVEQLILYIDSKQFSDLLDFGKFQNYSTLYERCREYRELHLQQSVDTNSLNQLQKDRIIYLETKLDVFNLSYIRHSVEIEIENKTMNEKHSDHKWNWWWKKKQKSNYERRTSNESVESYHNDGFSFYFEDLSNLVIDIKVVKLDLYLVSPLTNRLDRKIITNVVIHDAKIDVTKQSVSSSLLLNLFLSSFRLYGIENNHSDRRLLLKSISKSHSSPLFHVEFELFPVNRQRSDYRFHLILQPIQIIYDAKMFNRIVEYFNPQTKQTLFFQPEIKERTQSQMEEDLSCEKVFDLLVDLKKILLIFPENGVCEKNNSLLNFHTDGITLKSCLDERQSKQKFYVKYNVKIDNLRADYFNSNGSYWNILQQIPLIDMTFLKCIYSDEKYLDDWIIGLKIRETKKIDLSNETIEKFINHFNSIPNFNPTVYEILFRINLFFEVFRSDTSFKLNLSIDESELIIQLNPFTLIKTSLYMNLSKTRERLNKIILNLENIRMITDKFVYPLYLNKHLQLNYIN